MIEALLEQKSSITYSREQVFDLIAKDMPPEEAAFLAKHRDSLDLAIESVKPASDGDVFYLDAVVSVDEAAAIDAAVDRIVEAHAVVRVAEMLGPNRAQAQFLKNLTKELEKAGKALQGELESNPDLRNLLTDPEGGLNALVGSLKDCKVTF